MRPPTESEALGQEPCLKMSLLAMSAEAITIHAVKSTTVATGISSTSKFLWPKNKKPKGLRFGEREAKQQITSVRSISRDM
ncbi:hypothetical protein TNCV_3498031 [Trichonephila clavipes]|nr:hypothetical protein TNCV_3498031 [Trichonephila clavipes]